MPDSANEHLDTLRGLLAREPVSSILDVGMGQGNYGWFLRQDVRWGGRLDGIEAWGPYVQGPDARAGGNRTYYQEIHVLDVRNAEDLCRRLAPGMVFAFDVLEHMPEEDAVRVLRMLQRSATACVLVSLPIIPYPQGPKHDNPYEVHQRDWTAREMIALGSEMIGRGPKTGLFRFPGGRRDRLVTVMLNTARDDDAFQGRSLLGSIADDLEKQTMAKDLELVVIDGLHEVRSGFFERHHRPFRVLHVPPRPTAMVRARKCSISAYKNTGLMHARGELVITVDDGCTFDERFVERAWDAWKQKGVCLSALALGVEHDGTPTGTSGSRDSRHVYLTEDGTCVGPIGGNVLVPPMHGFTAFPIDAALQVNGYDEMYDGSRGIEDMDMGIRLQIAGHKIALDARHEAKLFPQLKWSAKIFGDNICGRGDTSVCKCSLTTLHLQLPSVLAGDYRANRRIWGPEKWKKVTPRCYLLSEEGECTLSKRPCHLVGTCADIEARGLQDLMAEPPVFDLAELRRENGIVS